MLPEQELPAHPSADDLPLLRTPSTPISIEGSDGVASKSQSSGGSGGGGCTRLRLLTVLCAVLGAFYAFYTLPVLHYLVLSSDWLKSRGIVGGLALVAFFWLIVVLCLPLDCASRVLAGFTFGFGPGCVIATAGMVGGTTITFLMSRAMGRAWVQRRLSRGGRFLLALDRAVAEQGFKMLLMVMMSMVPVSFWSYGFGVLSVSLHDFMFSSTLASLTYTLPIW